MKKTIHFYIIKEIITPLWVSLVVFTFVLLLSRVMSMAEMIFSRGIQPRQVGGLIVSILPYFFVFTLPMSTLLAVLLAFLRLSHDNEITAMKTAGISLYQLMPPVLTIGLITYLITSFLAIFALPWGNKNFKDTLYEIARTRADVGLKEKVFINDFTDMVIYINQIAPRDKTFEQVFISDEREPQFSNIIIAKRGSMVTDERRIISGMVLEDGIIQKVSHNYKTVQTVSFKNYYLKLNLQQLIEKRTEKGYTEMTVPELWETLNKLPPQDLVNRNLILMEIHKPFSIPITCLIMAILGASLGLQTKRSGRSWGVTLALAIFLIYYVFLSAAWSLGQSGAYPVSLGMWMPNVIFLTLGLYLLKRTAEEKPIALLELIIRLGSSVKDYVRKRFALA
ncbi:MAG: LPS export ABC transporter permease LptF [Deltaproteobacteria bacterium]|nr:LPS export ABC transporter permease LptF [Deltaproteobacteria bacterium]